MAVRDEFKVHRDAAGKRRGTRRPGAAAPVESVKVNRLVWQAAMRLADGDAWRIEIISTEVVRVENKSRRRRS